MMTTDQFFGLEKDNPQDHIRWFNKITSTIKYKDVPSSAIKLMLFPFSLAGVARQTTNLRNEISNFQQRFDESFHEAWDRYKDLLRACPHHGFTELHQLDTFYNALNPAEQDSLNAPAGGNLLERSTQDVLTIIENKSKVHNSRSKPIASQVKACDVNSNSSEIAKLTHAVNQQTNVVTTAMTAILKQFQATPPPAPVKAVKETCVTCGGAHPYYQCLAAGGNTFPEFRDNIQGYVATAAVNYNQGSGSLPSNTVANPKGELKAITTRSGLVINGPTVPTPFRSINSEEDERIEETFTNPNLAEYTIKVPPPPAKNYKPPYDGRSMYYAKLLRAPTEGYAEAIVVPPILAEQFELKHNLINMMTMDQFFGLEKDNPHDHIRWGSPPMARKRTPRSIHTWEDLVSKFINEFFPSSRTTNLACPHHGFTELHQLDTFYNALNPADQDSLNAAAGGNLLERRTQDVLTIIENKSKVCNSRNKSVVSQVKSCDANSNSSSEIAKLNHAVNQQMSAVTTAMTVILKQFQATPPPASVKSVEETCVTCGGAHPYYQSDFVIVDYESDPRVPLILGRPFLRIARALIDIHGEEMILRDVDERLTLNMRHDTFSYSNQPQKESINLIKIFNNSSEDFIEDLFPYQPSGNPPFLPHPELTSPEVNNDIFDLEGCNVLSEKLLDLDSIKDLHPPLHDNPLSGSTTYPLLEEFADDLPPEYDDNLYLKDSIDQKNRTNLADIFVDSIPEMFIDEDTLDYSSPSIFDVYADDFLKVESDAENIYNDPFDSKGEKIKESKLLIDELDLPCDFYPPFEYDSFFSQDFSRVDALPSTNNEDKLFNPSILIQEKPVKIIIVV
nr:hypothetical protein [Tanacetum cinerariifolium]